jgi:Domain of unknown function (DUF4259)
MGAWGVDVFDNDTACDYAAGVAETSNLAKIEATISGVLNSGAKYLEAPDGEEGLAAADIVARLRGNFGLCNVYTEDIDRWVKAVRLVPSVDLLDKARRAVDRVSTAPSELLDLWTESDEFEAWKSSVDGLRQRLA